MRLCGFLFFRKESCKKAFTEAQGLLLFNSKIKLTPLDIEGNLHCKYNYTYIYMYILL